MKDPLIVNFAPTGMVPTKAMNPCVPLSLEEIIEDVHMGYEMGVTIVHLHVRDQDGNPIVDPQVYANLIGAIRRYAPDLVICVSVSGRGDWGLEARLRPLGLDGDAKPDMASLTLGSLNFSRDTSENSPQDIKALAGEMHRRGILSELEVFDLGMVHYAQYLLSKKILEPPLYFNLMLGNIASLQLDLAHVGLLIKELPLGSLWSLGGIGQAQLGANALGITMGGGVRVGLEDNLYFDAEKQRLADNKMLLRRIRSIADVFERPFMPPGEFRRRLQLQPGGGKYGKKTPPIQGIKRKVS